MLDPFAGIGTTALVAGGAGREATGIEIMPVGVRAAQAISLVANGVRPDAIEAAGGALLEAVRGRTAARPHRFPHVPITELAFPARPSTRSRRPARSSRGWTRDRCIRSLMSPA